MPSTNDAALVSTLQQAGFSGDSLRIAFAIAKAESGGRATAYNPRPPDLSYGLFQINMIGNLGPDRRKRFNLSRNEDLFNPLTNARIAFQMSSGGTNWKPWTTFTSGKYQQYLSQFPGPQASNTTSDGGGVLDAVWGAAGGAAGTLITPWGVPRAALGLIPGLPDTEDIPVVGDVLSWGEAIAKAITWPFSNWDRMLEVLGGSIILLAGLYLAGKRVGIPGLAQIAPVLETPGKAFERGVSEGMSASESPKPRRSTRARAEGREVGKRIARSQRLGTPVDRAPRKRVALPADQPRSRPAPRPEAQGGLPQGF